MFVAMGPVSDQHNKGIIRLVHWMTITINAMTTSVIGRLTLFLLIVAIGELIFARSIKREIDNKYLLAFSGARFSS